MSDALEIANRLEGVRVREHYDLIPKTIAADELRRQHAEIESLRAQLAARVPDAVGPMLHEALAAAENAKTDPDEPEAAWALIEQRYLSILVQAAMLSATPSQQAPETTELRSVVFKVLEGWTLPHDVRSILEIAYYSQQAPVVQGEPVVGWIAKTGHGTHFRETITDELKSIKFDGRPYWRPVSYTHPQQASEPMTDEQAGELVLAWKSAQETEEFLVRMVELHHNIKEKQ